MIAFRPTADCHGSDGPSFLTEAGLPPRINDLQLGEIGGIPFLVDADQYKRWRCPDLVVDVREDDDEPGLGGGGGGCGLTLRASRRTGRSQRRTTPSVMSRGRSAGGSVTRVKASSKWVFTPMADGPGNGEDHPYDYDRTDADRRP